MVLTDASRHDWLEGRGPELTLIGFQDDATSQILSAHFQLEAENTLGYLRSVHAMVIAHGVPLSLYRDRHGIFQRNDPTGLWPNNSPENSVPPIWVALWKNSAFNRSPLLSPGQGRIERAWRTCQDRLVTNSASPRPAISTPPTRFSPASAPTTTNASPFRLARPSAIFRALPPRFDLARLPQFPLPRVVGPTTSSPSAPAPSPSPPCPPNVATPGTPSSSPITWTACYSSLIGRFAFVFALAFAAAGTCVSPPRSAHQPTENKKTDAPHLQLGGRPAVAAVDLIQKGVTESRCS